jgi:hypothetical protein
MEYDQRVLIRFFWNEGIDVHEITQRLQAQFHEKLMHFELSNFGLVTYVAVVKTFMMIFVSEDLLWMILMQKFWLYSTNHLLNRLDR